MFDDIQQAMGQLGEIPTPLLPPVTDSNGVLEINVGGELVATTRSTLCHFPDSVLGRMFGGDWDQHLARDVQGRAFLDFDPTCFKIILRYLRECKLAGPDDVVEQPSITAAIKPYYQRLVQYLMLDHLVITTHERFSSTLRTKNMKVSDSGLAVTHIGSSSRAEDVVGSASYTHGRVEIQLHIDELPPVNGQFVMVGMMSRQDVKKLFVGGEKSHQEFNAFFGWVYQDLGSGQRVCYRSLGPKGMSPSREGADWKSGDTLTMLIDFEQGLDTRISLAMGGVQHAAITGVPKAIELCLRIRLKHPGTRVSLLSN